ncbi:unnamed protein product [Ambrosiozyma monospora]|uniref:Unnamed protein product n=1 Tax=Ambrosiozyma monospora TaxID=43982 RepID=A0ACB5T5L8_AMBMO|nr:unnamed protein product [Ambrosiozyma monospora]
MMKAMCFLGKQSFKLLEVPKPTILEATDVVGKVLRTTICGSDLHMIDGFIKTSLDVAARKPGRGFTIGHEGIIKVTEVGSSVKNFKVGDICIASCISACGEFKLMVCKQNIAGFHMLITHYTDVQKESH